MLSGIKESPSVRNYLFTLFSGGMLALVIWSLSPLAHAAIPPQEVVRQASQEVLNTLEAEKTAIQADPQRLYTLVDNVLLNRMDFERMARWTLGKYWRRATPAQQQQFVNEFRTLLVRTYATALANYSGQKIRFLPQRDGNGGDTVTVRTEIEQPAGPAVEVDYSLHNKDGDWKAYDVIIDGISMVSNYRSTFSAEMRQGGIDALLESLSARNRQANNTL